MKNLRLGWITGLALILFSCGRAEAVGYTLSVSAQGSGTVTPDNTNNPHPPGVIITLTATPNAGWYFANWSGDVSGALNPLQVTMNSNLTIAGNFLAFPTYPLALVTNGQGTIALSPSGGTYVSNTVVTATAMPAAGWVFVTWSGATNTSVNPVALAVNTNVSLTATFAQLPAFDVQPVGVTNTPGSTLNFSTHAVGNAPLGYQWFFSGGPLTGATTNTTLTLTNVSPSQAGNYWVVATNGYGSATSQVACLTVTSATGPTNVVNSADEASLRAAIKIGGWVGLGFNGTITITNTIVISNNVVLDANNVSATISGGNAVRLFYVAPGVTFGATNLTLANGCRLVTNGAADAGAIYNDGGIVTLTACSLTNNSAQSVLSGTSVALLARGGAIFNNGGFVSLNQSVISNNAAIAGGFGTGLGGALYNTNGTVTITGCNVSSNVCRGSSVWQGMSQSGTGLAMGGAAFQTSGSLTIVSSIFVLNQSLGGNGSTPVGGSPPASPAYGGAVAAIGGSLSMDHSQFLTNQTLGGGAGYDGAAAPAYGGAIYCASDWTAADSAFLGNQAIAGNGSFNFGYSNAKGTNGYGGGIYNAGTLRLDRCSIYSNLSQGGMANAAFGTAAYGGDGFGGGIFNAGQLAITNCTITLNCAKAASGSSPVFYVPAGNNGNALGGGIFNSTGATSVLMNVTIASNFCTANGPGFVGTNGFSAGVQIANTNGLLRLHNSLVAYGGTNSNAYGPITDDGYNICSDASANLLSGSSYNYTDPKLAPLGDYGGPTLCMALLPDSPAIDFGDSTGIPNTDQRGFARPFGDGPDMGAYEYGPVLPASPFLNITATETDILLSFTASLPSAYRLQASTNLTTWTDLSTTGPFVSATNISQTVGRQGFSCRYFRLLMQ